MVSSIYKVGIYISDPVSRHGLQLISTVWEIWSVVCYELMGEEGMEGKRKRSGPLRLALRHILMAPSKPPRAPDLRK